MKILIGGAAGFCGDYAAWPHGGARRDAGARDGTWRYDSTGSLAGTTAVQEVLVDAARGRDEDCDLAAFAVNPSGLVSACLAKDSFGGCVPASRDFGFGHLMDDSIG